MLADFDSKKKLYATDSQTCLLLTMSTTLNLQFLSTWRQRKRAVCSWYITHGIFSHSILLILKEVDVFNRDVKLLQPLNMKMIQRREISFT